MIYLIFSFFYFIIFGALAFSEIDDRRYYRMLYFCIVIFWGLSYTHAADAYPYMEYFFYDVKTFSQGIDLHARGFESGFNLLAAICKSIIPEYIFFQFVLFAIEMALVISGFRKLLNREQSRPIITLLIFIYPCMLAATRQGVSIALIIFALHYIRAQNWKWYFGLIAIAYFFHHSSLIMAPLFFVHYIERYLRNIQLLLFILLVANFCWLTGLSLSDYLDSILSVFLTNESEIEKYAIYMNSTETAISNFGFAKIIEINVAYMGFMYYKAENEDASDVLTLCLVLYTIIGLMLGGILAHRFLYYFFLIYYVCVFIGLNAIVQKSSLHSFSNQSYILLAIYMFWFFIIKSQMIDQEFIFLPQGLNFFT